AVTVASTCCLTRLRARSLTLPSSNRSRSHWTSRVLSSPCRSRVASSFDSSTWSAPMPRSYSWRSRARPARASCNVSIGLALQVAADLVEQLRRLGVDALDLRLQAVLGYAELGEFPQR